MIVLYQEKWMHQEGKAYDHQGHPLNSFLNWCQKLEGFTGQEMVDGLAELEKRIKIAAGENKELWPPTYAQFMGICRPHKVDDGASDWRLTYAKELQDFKRSRSPEQAKRNREQVKILADSLK